MDVLASAAILEVMDISIEDSGGTAAGEPTGNVDGTGSMKAHSEVTSVDKENEEVRQRERDPQDSCFEPTLTTPVLIPDGQANDNHSISEVNGAACEEPEIQVGHPTEQLVRQRAVELFPDLAGACRA